MNGSLDRLEIYYQQATKAELLAARCFYYEAKRFALWLAAISGLDLERVSAIIAALSPRATWEGNQLDAIAIAHGTEPPSILGAGGSRNGFRQGGGAGFGAMPRDIRRAIRIASGEEVSDVLIGPKVNAFHRNIMEPGRDVGLPIDRHLFRALHGRLLPEEKVTRALGTNGVYQEAERMYGTVAARRGLRPIEYGNAIWYVMRRLSRDRGQFSLDTSALAWRPLYGVGSYHPQRVDPKLEVLPGCPYRPWLHDEPTGPSYGHETRDHRGRVRVGLGPSHRFANSGGWQYRYRLLVAYDLGRLPVGGTLTQSQDVEHVHHLNGTVDDDRIENLEVLSASIHGQTHARAVGVAKFDPKRGSLREVDQPKEWNLTRWGPVVSSRTIGSGLVPESTTLEGSS